MLGEKLQCEGALVTAGAASALTQGHRYDYDHALLNCGIRFVTVETVSDYEKAFNGRTVMTHFFNAAEEGQISREDWVRIAHRHNVPCFNDASVDVPPISNLWNDTKMGFDLVTFSGGKGMRRPQNAGLLLGRKDLITAAVANDAPISESVGRGMSCQGANRRHGRRCGLVPQPIGRSDASKQFPRCGQRRRFPK